MDVTEVAAKARNGFKGAFANKPKIGYAKAHEISENARKALHK
jgi:hypothetical protein